MTSPATPERSPQMHVAALASVRVGLAALRLNPLRTVLATLGVIVGVGSLFGLLVAFSVTAVMRTTLDVPMYAGVSLSALAVAAPSTIIVGTTVGTYPALRAARLSAIDAIRHG